MSWWKEPTEGFSEKATVVVVGSGAGGAVAALTLAEAGIDVVLVEGGFRHQAPDFPDNVAGAVGKLFQEGGFRTMTGKPPIPLAGGEALGGSTVVNSAISFRTPEAILEEWNHLSGGAFEDTADYYRAQDEVEAELFVGTTPEHLLSGLDKVHRDAANALGWSNHNFRRNTPTCVGCGRCNTGCVVGGKNSVDRAFLPRAADAGARIYTGCMVDRVEAGAVHGKVLGRDKEPVGSFSVRADRVVLSGGTVSTPRLLLDSDLVKKVGEVGRGLRIHPVFSVLAMFDRPVVSPGSSQGHYVDEFAADDIILESNPTLVGAVFQQLPLFGKELMEVMKRASHIANTGAMIRDRSTGRILPSRGAGARVHYSVEEVDRQRAMRGMRHASELWFGHGAEWVTLNVYGAPLCRNMAEVNAVLNDDLNVNRLMGYSSHPQASCSVGRATDHMGQLREVPGVHAIDASALPSNVGRNPQISVMTVARILSERVAADLGKTPRRLYRGEGLPHQCPQHGVPCGMRPAPALPVLPG